MQIEDRAYTIVHTSCVAASKVGWNLLLPSLPPCSAKPKHFKTVKGFRETGMWSEIVTVCLEAEQISVERWNWKQGVRCFTLSVSGRKHELILFCSTLVIQWTSLFWWFSEPLLPNPGLLITFKQGGCHVWQLEIMTRTTKLCWKGVNDAE